MRVVEDRDPVYSAEPVPILVFGARCFSWESDLWSRPDRTWTTPSCWTERDLNYGPVSTWYRLWSCFPPTGGSCASARPPVRRNLFVRVTRGPVSGYSLAHHRGLVPAQKTGPSNEGCCPRNNDHCPLECTQTPCHKTHPVSLWLPFSDLFCGQLQRIKKTGPSGGRCCRSSLLLSRSTMELINAQPQSMHPVDLWLLRGEVWLRSPLFRNILKVQTGILNKSNF